MNEQELILLGLLRESPKHGYEIKRKIKEILSLFAGVSLKSVYYPLRALEKKGLLIKHVTKHGKRPERLVYALTPKGNSRFQELLQQSFLNFKRPQFSLDLSLYFLPFIKAAIARRRLRARLTIVKRLCRDLGQMIRSSRKKGRVSLARILEHNLKMLEAESVFLTQLIQTL